ncbi:MAG: carbohydrate ABC transporter permease [Turicibacter sp.]|nr:carbohydrate ABC transporter permease [Turicibacter sp.]
MKKKWPRVFLYVILIIYAAITLYPFLWAVFASFKTYAEIVGGGLTLLPQNPTLNNYIHLFTRDENFVAWIWNSLYVAGFAAFLNVIFNSMAGYALARLSFPGKKSLFLLILALIMVPGQILLIPNFLIMRNIGLLDTHWSLILPSAINFAFIFMMRQFFINFPKDIEEAAAIDGLSRFQIFFRIVIPMARASVATQGIMSFLAVWNEFMRPLLYISSPRLFTLPLGLQMFNDLYTTHWNLVMAGSVITLIPILLLYIVLNKYFMQGFRVGGDK